MGIKNFPRSINVTSIIIRKLKYLENWFTFLYNTIVIYLILFDKMETQRIHKPDKQSSSWHASIEDKQATGDMRSVNVNLRIHLKNMLNKEKDSDRNVWKSNTNCADPL